jgi:NAD(P)-dependent dehydrogenase (short-subunit alcohol dehydrogenase family)
MANELDFSGKTALITGAASGIGAASARWLDAHGAAQLVLVDIDRPGLDRLGLSCKVQPFGGNVGDPALWNLLAREIGHLDHAVINAGISGPGKAIVDLDITDWRQTMATNLDGSFLALRCAMRNMARPGPDGLRGGSVVLMGSVAGLKGVAPLDYGASKAAVIHMARIAAREGAAHGIRVNAIAPGAVDTPIWDSLDTVKAAIAKHGNREAAIAEIGRAGTPLGRMGSAEEVAAQIGFLLSNLAATITGTVLVSDGGYSI